MAFDPEHLRKHYQSLSDDALLEIDETELVPEAVAILEAELDERGLLEPAEDGEYDAEGDEDEEGSRPDLSSRIAGRYRLDKDHQDWEEEAAVVLTTVELGDDIVHAREALQAVGMPAKIRLEEVVSEGGSLRGYHQLIVPGQWALDAISIVDRDVLNEQAEQDWIVHFETMSDADFSGLDIDILLAGMEDRLERLKNAYYREREARKL